MDAGTNSMFAACVLYRKLLHTGHPLHGDLRNLESTAAVTGINCRRDSFQLQLKLVFEVLQSVVFLGATMRGIKGTY